MLRDDINNALKDAMKGGEKRVVSTLRLVNAALKNADIEARGLGKGALADADIHALLHKMIKQRQEAVELYDRGGRPELAQQERDEMAIIATYLPQQMAQDEIAAAAAAAIAETGAAGIKDMGKVIGALRAKYAGQMDFAKASALVKGMLAAL
ncbi:MAG: GatB/YqeY domain-containing protein [Proteobacteria bacterium]|nr:GatB/YqeY domain-containing protein [Pseudomonadota bacterium]